MKLTNKDIFKRRMQSKIIFLLSVIVLYTVSSIISGFENGLAFLSVPKGVLWLFQKFIPNGKTLQYLPKIMKPAIETILLALTSTLISSMFALVMAVIGSETLGVSKIAHFLEICRLWHGRCYCCFPLNRASLQGFCHLHL